MSKKDMQHIRRGDESYIVMASLNHIEDKELVEQSNKLIQMIREEVAYSLINWYVKRYLVFSGSHYDPDGGWSDFQGAFDRLGDAQEYIEKLHYDWNEIVDLTMMTVVERVER